MNKTKIEWCNYSWNPVTGCKHNCPYCYAKLIYHRFWGGFAPAFHPERLDQPRKVKKPSRVFVCSVADLFGSWVPQTWIDQVFEATQDANQHTYIYLTKSTRIKQVSFPDNSWVGVTIDGLTRKPQVILDALLKTDTPLRFVSFEPLLSDVSYLNLDGVDWVIIGAQTGSKKVQPEPEWVNALISQCDAKGIPVFLKDNLTGFPSRREFPTAAVVN